MVSEIFESFFWVGPGFIPKSHLVESFSNNDRNKEKYVKETENRSIKSEIIIVMRYFLSLGLRNKEKK
jgi:hypothetical protein